MTHITCRLTAKNRNQLRNPTIRNRVWTTFTTLETSNFVHGLAMWSLSFLMSECMFATWAWSGSREQFLHCGLKKISPQQVVGIGYRWYPLLARGRFLYDAYEAMTMKATRSRHGWVHMFITHRPTVTLQLHNFDFFRTCRTSSFCTVALQLARFQLTRRIARSLGDSWSSSLSIVAIPMHFK